MMAIMRVVVVVAVVVVVVVVAAIIGIAGDANSSSCKYDANYDRVMDAKIIHSWHCLIARNTIASPVFSGAAYRLPSYVARDLKAFLTCKRQLTFLLTDSEGCNSLTSLLREAL